MWTWGGSFRTRLSRKRMRSPAGSRGHSARRSAIPQAATHASPQRAEPAQLRRSHLSGWRRARNQRRIARMPHTSRRRFLQIAAIAVPVGATLDERTASASANVADAFPSQPRELVEEMVVVAHGNVARVKELVGRQPTLAKATFDWGFGDWETALGAASHVGNREIADLLLANGAHPTIFSAAMLGQLDVVKAFVAASPGIQRTRGPHSISLMRHAMAGGPRAAAVIEYLKSIEGADDRVATQPLTAEEIAELTGLYT